MILSTETHRGTVEIEMLVTAVLSVVVLLGLLTLISTLIGRRMPQILDVLEAGASEAVRQQALRYAA